MLDKRRIEVSLCNQKIEVRTSGNPEPKLRTKKYETIRSNEKGEGNDRNAARYFPEPLHDRKSLMELLVVRRS